MQNFAAIAEVTAGELASYEGMNQHFFSPEHNDESRFRSAEVLDPH